MRIALLTHSVLPRGAVVHALELADALTARGHAVTVVAPALAGQALFRQPSSAVRLIEQPAVGGTLVEQVGQRIGALVRGLPAVLDAGRFDLLHAQDSLSGNALATLAEAGHLHTPWLRTVHHLDDFRQPQLDAWQRRAWRAADAIGCVSDTWCRHFAAAHGLTAQRLYNGVNLRRYTPDGPRHDGPPYVLALGGVEARKNTPRLLEAFARLRERDPAARDLRLVVAGGASLLDHGPARQAWMASLQRLGLGEGPDKPVQVLGPVPDAELPALLRGAQCLAMPSLAEGFGLVALEALACGTPVLVSDRPPFTEHLTGCAHVAWCDPESVESIAAGLARACALPRPATPPPVCVDHAWSRSAAVHEAWYARVLAREAVPC
jgi:glycosyltransferase-like protein